MRPETRQGLGGLVLMLVLWIAAGAASAAAEGANIVTLLAAVLALVVGAMSVLILRGAWASRKVDRR